MDSNIRQSLRHGLKPDYKSFSHFTDFSKQSNTRGYKNIFRKKRVQPTTQGAVRIQNFDHSQYRKRFNKKKVASFFAVFLLCVILASISNGPSDSNAGPSLFGARTSAATTVETPDFYFIESSHFIPGSERLTLASYQIQDAADNKVSLDNRKKTKKSERLKTSIRTNIPPDGISPPSPKSTKKTTVEKEIIVKSGDTLSQIMLGQGLEGSDLHQFLNLSSIKEHLSTLQLNQKFNVSHSIDGEFIAFSLRLGQEKKLRISRQKDKFISSVISLPITRSIQVTEAKIDSSLFLAGQSAGLSQKTIMNLVDIFQWDIDFSLDIRKGDGLRVVYEKLYRNGEYLGEGDIVAAEFVNSGKSLSAIRYTDLNGRTNYYTPDGRSMRKAFLRNPVDVVRITSHYNPNRKHPVLHTIRAHKGTDYGAPIGTPIRSTGDGKIIFAARKGGYGKTVILKHGDKYTTLYAHMSKFAKSTKAGRRVQQGQIIGYVGRTGRVTGAHLHYEFRIHNRHKNPLRVKLPGAKPIPKKYLADFRNKSKQYVAILEGSLDGTVASR